MNALLLRSLRLLCGRLLFRLLLLLGCATLGANARALPRPLGRCLLLLLGCLGLGLTLLGRSFLATVGLGLLLFLLLLGLFFLLAVRLGFRGTLGRLVLATGFVLVVAPLLLVLLGYLRTLLSDTNLSRSLKQGASWQVPRGVNMGASATLTFHADI